MSSLSFVISRPDGLRASQREPQRQPQKAIESLREPRRFSLVLFGSLWLSLALSGSLSGSLWLSQALPGSLRLSLARSGSLWLSIALRVCLQSPCLAHKALARLVASLLRYSTFFSPVVINHDLNKINFWSKNILDTKSFIFVIPGQQMKKKFLQDRKGLRRI